MKVTVNFNGRISTGEGPLVSTALSNALLKHNEKQRAAKSACIDPFIDFFVLAEAFAEWNEDVGGDDHYSITVE